MMQPQSIVAVILAITVMLFMLSNTGFGVHFLGMEKSEPENQGIVEAWLNVMNVLIGGLIGYIAGKKG